jgi:hypothetical protein
MRAPARAGHPIAHGEHVDALLGAYTGYGDIDRVDEAGGGGRACSYDRQAAAHSRVDAKNIHHDGR